MKAHRREAGGQVDDAFSLAEPQGQWISCRRGSVHLFLLGSVIDGSFLLMILPWGDTSSCN